MYAFKKIVAKLKHYRDRTCNMYGSSKITLIIESGRMDGDKKEAKYSMNETKGFERWSGYEGVRYLSVEKLKGNKQENMQIKKRKAR